MIARIFRTVQSACVAACVAPCLVCGGHTVGQQDICQGCRSDYFAATVVRCRRCALSLPMPTRSQPASATCGPCAAATPPFKASFALADYCFPVDSMVLALKTRTRLDIGRVLGSLMGERLLTVWQVPPSAAVLAVPLAPDRLLERGYNQSHELARALSARTGLPLLDQALVQRQSRPAQRSLDQTQRLANLRGAFQVMGHVPPVILVVDDVMTTGATLAELARTLIGGGAVAVYNAVVARTPSPANPPASLG